MFSLTRYSKKPSVPLSAITTPSGVFVICMLVGYIVYAAWNRYDIVKEDCRKMGVLKKQAEAADVAKSQVSDHYSKMNANCLLNGIFIAFFLSIYF